jgi:hypothetical protein
MPKKQSVDSSKPAASVTESKPGPAVVRRHNKIVREYDDFVPAEADARGVGGTEETDWQDVDLVELAFDEFDDDQGYTLRVERLTVFNRTGRSNSTAPREYCGEWAFQPDYMQQIQSQYGPGVYRLTVIDRANRFKKAKTVHIAAPLQAQAQQPSSVQSLQQPQQSTQPNQAEQFRQYIKGAVDFLRDMRDLMPQPPTTATPVATVERINPNIEITKEIIQLAKAEPGLAREVVKMAFGAGFGDQQPQTESPFLSFLGKALDQVVDKMGPLLVDRMFVNAPAAGAPGATPTTAGQIPASAGPHTLIETAEQAYARVIRQMVENMRVNASTYGSVDALFDLIEKHPSLAQYISVLVSATPNEVLNMLCSLPGYENIREIPHAEQWIAALQHEYRAEVEAGSEQTNATDSEPEIQ